MASLKKAIEEYGEYRGVPWTAVHPILDAIREGATYRDAADAGGLPPHHVIAWLTLGDRGHKVWKVVSMALRQARAEARSPAYRRRRQLIPQATMGQTSEYLRTLEADTHLPPEQPAPGQGAAIQINIQKDFDPLPSPVEVIEAEDAEVLPAGDE